MFHGDVLSRDEEQTSGCKKAGLFSKKHKLIKSVIIWLVVNIRPCKHTLKQVSVTLIVCGVSKTHHDGYLSVIHLVRRALEEDGLGSGPVASVCAGDGDLTPGDPTHLTNRVSVTTWW